MLVAGPKSAHLSLIINRISNANHDRMLLLIYFRLGVIFYGFFGSQLSFLPQLILQAPGRSNRAALYEPGKVRSRVRLKLCIDRCLTIPEAFSLIQKP